MRTSKLAALLLAGLLLTGCVEAQTERHSVAIVAKSTSTEFWGAVFAGAEAAAAEYNLDLSISGPETEEDYETQNAMIARAVEDGAEALVFSAIDFEANAAAINDAARRGVRIVVIDSGVDSDAVETYIGTDNLAAGRMAAEAALQCETGLLKVGLVNYDINSANGQLREKGAREALKDSGRAQVTAALNTFSEAGAAMKDTLAMLERYPEINMLIAFNEPTSVGAARALEAAGREGTVSLVGFDSNVETVDALQTGLVDALIVQNTYAIGYLGVESAYRLLTGRGGAMLRTVDTATRIVTRENMFTIDGQKTLFAFE